ncbi:MAG: hypothetical protein WAV56_04585 [Microgenomates group bacterium]
MDSIPGGGSDGRDVKDFFFPGIGGSDGDIPGVFGGGGFADTELKNIGAGNVALDPDTDVTLERDVDG